jgi:tetratricopeptide (TPR) repeat protein
MKYIQRLTFLNIFSISILVLLGACSSSPKSTKYDISHILAKDFIMQVDTTRLQKAAIRHVVRGSTLQNQGEFALSVIEFQEALRYDKSPGIYLALANSYRNLYKFELAHESIRNAIDLDPEFEPAYLLLVEILIPLRRYEEAIQTLEFCYDKFGKVELLIYIASVYEYTDKRKALEYFSKVPEDKLDLFTLYRISELSKSLKDTVNQKKTLLKMIAKAPDNFNPHSVMLDFYLENKDLESAIDLVFSTEKKWNFDDVKSMYSRVGVYFLMNSFETDTAQAQRYVERIDNRFQFDDFMQFVGGAVNQQIGDTVKADKFLTYLLKNGENDAFNAVEIAQIYVFSSRWDKVIEVLKDFENAEDDMRYHYFFGIAYMQTHDYQAAENLMLQALKLDSDNADIMSNLGYIYHELEEYDKSNQYYKKAMMIMPDNALLNNNYAYTLSEQNIDLQKALEMSEFSLKEDPDNASYLDTYGWIMFKMGKYDTALKYLLKSYEKTESVSAEICLHLVEVYLKLNDIENAKKYLKIGLDMFPKDKKLLDLSVKIK